jgi:hypothetical protein
MSDTLGRPPPAALEAAGFFSAFGAGDSPPAGDSPAGSLTAVPSAFGNAAAAEAFSARAAARISATDIFFFSAIASSWQRASEPCKSRFVRV